MNFFDLSMTELANQIKSKRITAVEVATFCLNKAKETKDLNAFTVLDQEYVLAQAKQVDKKIAEGKPVGRLAGVPVGIKDNMNTDFYPTTCASDCFKDTDLLPKTDCQVVKQIREQDAVIFAKTNMDELAMGFSSTNTAYGEVSNPYNTEYSAGGSSGGSAVAVSVGSVFCALGSDTGGSIRQPAANCGVVGFKPTFNSVSRDGVFPLSKTLDHVGTLTKTVRDCAEFFSIIQKNSRDYSECFSDKKRTFKVSYLADFKDATIDDDVKDAYFKAIDLVKDMGHQLQPAQFAFSKSIAETYQVLCSVDGVNSFEEFNKIHPNTIVESKCRKEVNKRVNFAKSVLKNDPTAIDRALINRERVREYIDQLFDTTDIVLSPTTLLHTSKKHEEVSNEKGFTSDLFSIICNLTGIPAMTIPMGLDANGIPVGLQIITLHNREEDLFAFAYMMEKALKK